MRFVVGVTWLEHAIPSSQMKCGTNSATPRFYEFFLKVVKYVVRRISDQVFRKTKSPWQCSVKGNVRKTALQNPPQVLCSQMSRATNCATPRFMNYFQNNNNKSVNSNFTPFKPCIAIKSKSPYKLYTNTLSLSRLLRKSLCNNCMC